MAFELKRFGIGMKTISPGGMKTDFYEAATDGSFSMRAAAAR